MHLLIFPFFRLFCWAALLGVQTSLGGVAVFPSGGAAFLPLLWVGLLFSSLLLGGAAWPLPSLGGVAFPSPICVVLPSSPFFGWRCFLPSLHGGACPLPNPRRSIDKPRKVNPNPNPPFLRCGSRWGGVLLPSSPSFWVPSCGRGQAITDKEGQPRAQAGRANHRPKREGEGRATQKLEKKKKTKIKRKRTEIETTNEKTNDKRRLPTKGIPRMLKLERVVNPDTPSHAGLSGLHQIQAGFRETPRNQGSTRSRDQHNKPRTRGSSEPCRPSPPDKKQKSKKHAKEPESSRKSETPSTLLDHHQERDYKTSFYHSFLSDRKRWSPKRKCAHHRERNFHNNETGSMSMLIPTRRSDGKHHSQMV